MADPPRHAYCDEQTIDHASTVRRRVLAQKRSWERADGQRPLEPLGDAVIAVNGVTRHYDEKQGRWVTPRTRAQWPRASKAKLCEAGARPAASLHGGPLAPIPRGMGAVQELFVFPRGPHDLRLALAARAA